MKLLILLLMFFLPISSWAVPPYSGTIFIDPDIVTANDPTSFQNAIYTGRSVRTMFDRRVDTFIQVNAFVFKITFSDGLTAEALINPEFNTVEAAAQEANKYGRYVGQLPFVLREDVKTISIHRGVELFGGGYRDILIHTGQSQNYLRDGILEETLIHEASHVSLDSYHSSAAGWLTAQRADVEFISTYARDNPNREDIAESFLLWFAVQHRNNTISQTDFNKITQTIPNRITYFNGQNFNLTPLVDSNGMSEARAILISPIPATTLTSTTHTFRWDKPVDATNFDLLLGTTGPGSTDIRASAITPDTSVTINNLPSRGQTIYARLWTYKSKWEFRDYTYTALSQPICRAPEQLRATLVNSTFVNIAWNSVAAPTYYIYYRAANSPWKLVVNGLTATSFRLNNLKSRTAYEVDVYSRCPGANLVSQRLFFTTKRSR